MGGSRLPCCIFASPFAGLTLIESIHVYMNVVEPCEDCTKFSTFLYPPTREI